MNLVLGFSPFIIFFLLSRLSADLALWSALAAAFVVTMRDFMESPSLRLLDVGSLLIFGVLALVRGFVLPGLGLQTVRLLAELAMFLLLTASICLRQPFSLQYARQDPGETWPPGLFLKINYLTSIVWLLAFGLMTGADAAAGLLAFAPVYPAIAIGVAALSVAILFTLGYPARAARKLARAA